MRLKRDIAAGAASVLNIPCTDIFFPLVKSTLFSCQLRIIIKKVVLQGPGYKPKAYLGIPVLCKTFINLL